jgi:3-oxoacyl-[acyl-carrier protein] reductase
LAASAPAGAVLAVGDVSVPADVDAVCTLVETELGPIDVLVNAAGVYGQRVPFTSGDPEEWWRVLETNLRGPALLCRRLVPAMVARGRGHVVNVNSRAAIWDDPGESSVAYSTSKAGLARLTSALAAEVEGTGVVVIDLSPGLVRTGMTATRLDLDRLPEGSFLPPSAIAERIVAVVDGRYDALSGHFVHARDDLDDLLGRIRDDGRRRRLGLTPYGSDDPLA